MADNNLVSAGDIADMYGLLVQADPAEMAEILKTVEMIGDGLLDALLQVFQALPSEQEVNEATIILGISQFMLKAGKVLQMMSDQRR